MLYTQAQKVLEAKGEMLLHRIAYIWSGILNIEITAEQVALCMVGLKLCRESHRHKDDNIVDIYGYTLCLESMLDGDKIPEEVLNDTAAEILENFTKAGFPVNAQD